jgi:hypothetical protein
MVNSFDVGINPGHLVKEYLNVFSLSKSGP